MVFVSSGWDWRKLFRTPEMCQFACPCWKFIALTVEAYEIICYCIAHASNAFNVDKLPFYWNWIAPAVEIMQLCRCKNLIVKWKFLDENFPQTFPTKNRVGTEDLLKTKLMKKYSERLLAAALEFAERARKVEENCEKFIQQKRVIKYFERNFGERRSRRCLLICIQISASIVCSI